MLVNEIQSLDEKIKKINKEMENKKKVILGLLEREKRIQELSVKLKELYKKAGIEIVI